MVATQAFGFRVYDMGGGGALGTSGYKILHKMLRETASHWGSHQDDMLVVL